ncbi:unnamed protein product, partial [Urochloa humidicola]
SILLLGPPKVPGPALGTKPPLPRPRWLWPEAGWVVWARSGRSWRCCGGGGTGLPPAVVVVAGKSEHEGRRGGGGGGSDGEAAVRWVTSGSAANPTRPFFFLLLPLLR